MWRPIFNLDSDGFDLLLGDLQGERMWQSISFQKRRHNFALYFEVEDASRQLGAITSVGWRRKWIIETAFLHPFGRRRRNVVRQLRTGRHCVTVWLEDGDGEAPSFAAAVTFLLSDGIVVVVLMS